MDKEELKRKLAELISGFEKSSGVIVTARITFSDEETGVKFVEHIWQGQYFHPIGVYKQGYPSD